MTENANEDKIFKANHAAAHNNIRGQINKDITENLEKFKDPVILGELVYLLKDERENTNRILKTLLTKIEALELKLAEKEQIYSDAKIRLLPKVDEAIVSFLKEGPKTAEDVQKKFGYKGKNAASARLNRLYDLGVVVKKHAGKTVFFLLV
ncbi:MAG: helix-turn-helix domain-containing protein [Candidatus Micrarchaeota archaeon]